MKTLKNSTHGEVILTKGSCFLRKLGTLSLSLILLVTETANAAVIQLSPEGTPMAVTTLEEAQKNTLKTEVPPATDMAFFENSPLSAAQAPTPTASNRNYGYYEREVQVLGMPDTKEQQYVLVHLATNQTVATFTKNIQTYKGQSTALTVPDVGPDGDYALLAERATYSTGAQQVRLRVKNLKAANAYDHIDLTALVGTQSPSAFEVQALNFFKSGLDTHVRVTAKSGRIATYNLRTGQMVGSVIVGTPYISPSPNLTSSQITPLPKNQPIPVKVSGNPTSIGQTTRGITIAYDTRIGGWAGGAFVFDDFQTLQRESANFSSHADLVFGLKGNPSRVKFEIEDIFGRKYFVYLTGAQPGAEGIWKVSMDHFRTKVDLTKIHAILFVMEWPSAITGTLDVFVKPAGPVDVLPTAGLTESDVTRLPGALKVTRVAPMEDQVTSIAQTAKGIRIDYKTVAAWAGGGFTWDDYSTPSTIETVNLSQMSQLTFGIRGIADRIKLEVIDVNNKRGILYLTGFRSDKEQYWRVTLSNLAKDAGFDISRVAHIFFVAEGINEIGFLDINVKGPSAANEIYPDSALTNRNISGLPPRHQIRVAPSGNTSSIGSIARGLRINYNTTVGGWAGGGYDFDNLNTVTRESADLSGLSDLKIGLKGDASRVKVELIDRAGNRSVVYLASLSRTQELVWKIPMSRFQGIDLRTVQNIFFIVESPDVTGAVDIFVEPTVPPVPTNIQPDPNMTSVNLQALPTGSVNGLSMPTIAHIGPPDSQTSVGLSNRGIQVNYKNGASGWSGGGFSYDHFGTAPFESKDLSGLAELRFGITGTTSRLKFEIIDADNRKQVFYLEQIEAGREKIWRIPTAYLTGVDLKKIRLMYFIAEGANQTGGFSINHKPGPNISLYNSTYLKDVMTPAGPVKIYSHILTVPEKLLVFNPRTGEIVVHDTPGIRRADQIKFSDTRGQYLVAERGNSAGDVVYLVPLQSGLGNVITSQQPAAFAPFVTSLGYFQTPQGIIKMYYYNQRGNNTIYFWNPRTGQYVVNTLPGVYGLDQVKGVSPDGKKVVLAGSINQVYVVSLVDNTPPTTIHLPTTSAILSATFTSNTEMLITQANGKRFRYNLVTNTLTPLN